MLSEIVSDRGVTNYVIWTQSELVKQYISDKIIEKHEIEEYHIIKNDNLTRDDLIGWLSHYTFTGKRWFYKLDITKEKSKESFKGYFKLFMDLVIIRNTSIKVFFVEDYSLFRFMVNSDFTKNNMLGLKFYYQNKFNRADIEFLTDELAKEGIKVKKEVKDFLKKEYLNNPELVLKLYYGFKQDNPVLTKDQVVEAIGYGGNTVDNLVLDLLTTSASTEQGFRRKEKEVINKIHSLKKNKEMHPTVGVMYNYYLNTLKTLLDIKELYYLGIIKADGKYSDDDLPKHINKYSLSRFKRRMYDIIGKVSVIDILQLYSELIRETDQEVAILVGSLRYLNNKKRWLK